MAQIIHPGGRRNLTNPHGGDKKKEIYILNYFCRNVEISTNLQGLLRRSPSNPPGEAGPDQERGVKAGGKQLKQNKFFCTGKHALRSVAQ